MKLRPYTPVTASGPSLETIANGDPGLALWLEDDGAAGMRVSGFRFATRTRFDPVPKPLLVRHRDEVLGERQILAHLRDGGAADDDRPRRGFDRLSRAPAWLLVR